MEPAYFMALTTGVLGGFGHCIGMCGPIVASYTLAAPSQKSQNRASKFIPHLLYNFGRITTYGLIGAVMGLSGSFVNVAGNITGIQNLTAIAAGSMMIIMGLTITGLMGSASWIEKHNLFVLKAAHHVRESSSRLRYYLLGLLLGLLPCGLSYTVFIAAAGTGRLIPGMITAVLFGIGTLPALFLFGTIISTLSAALRSSIYRASGFLVMLMGLYFLVKGMRLHAGL